MSNERSKVFSPATKGAFLSAAIVVIAALGARRSQQADNEPAPPLLPALANASPPAERPSGEANAGATHDARSAPAAASGARANAPSVRAEATATLPAKLGIFLDRAVGYYKEDRAQVVEDALAKVIAGGAASVFEIQRQLSDTPIYDQDRRAAAFHALERIGKALAPSDPRRTAALTAIQSMANRELELPNLVEPNPEIDVETLAPTARDELLHQGVLVEHEGVLLQSTALNKLPVIRLLTNLGGKAAHEQLERLAAAPDNAPGVQLAAEQALAIASR